MDNVGEVKNTGYEAMISGYLMRDTHRNIIWSMTAKLAYTKNEITKLSEAIKRQNELYKSKNVEINQLLYEGYAQNSIWAVPSMGIDPSTGYEIFLDKNGNPMVALHWEKYMQHAREKYNKELDKNRFVTPKHAQITHESLIS